MSMIMLSLLASSPDLGTAEGRCRPHETGPAIIVEAAGLKDRLGTLRLELYPPTRRDFLADDSDLVAAGKTFRRTIVAVPRSGPALLCIRAPVAGPYALSLTHDRAGHSKFDLEKDGIGFANNPTLGLGPPRVDDVVVEVGSQLTSVRIVMNYRFGLIKFGPIDRVHR